MSEVTKIPGSPLSSPAIKKKRGRPFKVPKADNNDQSVPTTTTERQKSQNITTTYIKGDRDHAIAIANQYQNNEISIQGVMEELDVKKTRAYLLMNEFRLSNTIVFVGRGQQFLDETACAAIEHDRHLLDAAFKDNVQFQEWIESYVRQTWERTGILNWKDKEFKPSVSTMKKWKDDWFPKSVKKADNSTAARRFF